MPLMGVPEIYPTSKMQLNVPALFPKCTGPVGFPRQALVMCDPEHHSHHRLTRALLRPAHTILYCFARVDWRVMPRGTI